MFWSKAREKFAGVTADDDDVKRYLKISSEFQQSGYAGVTGAIQDIGHRWIAKRTRAGLTLELGFGAGRHNLFYSGKREDYIVSEYSHAHLKSKQWNQVRGRAVQCDARRLPFRSVSFETVISIYNLEHIQELDLVLNEVHRILVERGQFLVALPCEGGFAWNLGRELTTRKQFQDKYRINYDKVIAFEHVRDYEGVYKMIEKCGLFQIVRKRFFPWLLPSVDLNLIACIECRKI